MSGAGWCVADQGLSMVLRREVFDRVTAALLELTDDLSGPGDAISTVLENSVRQNFEEGGRPNKWPQSKRAASKGGQTLRDTDRLYNSITSAFDIQEGGVRVGTNVEYAAAHHFGVDAEVEQQVREHVRIIKQAFGKELDTPMRVTVRAHSRTMHIKIHDRPFMLMQDEDWDTVKDIIQVEIESIMQEAGR